MVAFEPGRMRDRHRRAAACPAARGPHDVGFRLQRIEIVEIGDMRQDRHGDRETWRPARRCAGSIERQRILGRQTPRASEKRHEPKRRPAARSAIAGMPSANSVGSPRNLLTMKPAISAASTGSSTALVPTRLAITPPRSMSPIKITGTLAARAKPILAMSLLAQIDLRRAARAFDQHQIGFLLQPREAFEHVAAEASASCSCIRAPLPVPMHLALHDDLRADLALRFQQHRVHMDRWRDAGGCACSAWARPISPPSA